MDEYLDVIGEYGRVHTKKDFNAGLFGSWGVQVGELDTCVHIWYVLGP